MYLQQGKYGSTVEALPRKNKNAQSDNIVIRIKQPVALVTPRLRHIFKQSFKSSSGWILNKATLEKGVGESQSLQFLK